MQILLDSCMFPILTGVKRVAVDMVEGEVN